MSGAIDWICLKCIQCLKSVNPPVCPGCGGAMEVVRGKGK